MGLFSPSAVNQINAIAAKSKELVPQEKPVSSSITDTLKVLSQQVLDYFSDSEAELIHDKETLHRYVDRCIAYGYAGIDTETTGLDRIRDTIVGWSLYVPGQHEVYIPCKHKMPIFETYYPGQLSYEDCAEEIRRLERNRVRLIFANADFDLSMIFKDFKVDLTDVCYYDVILAWRCLREDEKDNSLKGLYAKYPKKGKVDPKKFSDFFTPALFPYCKPEIAALYAANDAKITFELFMWQLPYVTKDSEKCKKHHLEKIADLVWNIEFPMIKVCAMLHRRGIYLDETTIAPLHVRYQQKMDADSAELAKMVQQLIDEKDAPVNRKRPFRTGADFNPNSNPHVLYLIKTLLDHPDASSTGKEVLKEINHPVTQKILDVRAGVKLLGTYIDKMPAIAASDSRVHCSFKSIGAATGRMCIAAGTRIKVLDGEKNIEDIVPGDLVYGYNKDRFPEVFPVLNQWRTGTNKKCVRILWKDSQSSQAQPYSSLLCTPEHLIARDTGEWARADSLKYGDKLLWMNTNLPAAIHHDATVVEVREAYYGYDVYDIEVGSDTHHFVANGIVVHNSSESPNLQNIPSKLHDIRHMFRATPEITELMDVEDNMIVLFDIDRITVKDKGLTYVKDLVIGDIVTLFDGQERCEFKITGLETLEDTASVKIELAQIFE